MAVKPRSFQTSTVRPRTARSAPVQQELDPKWEAQYYLKLGFKMVGENGEEDVSFIRPSGKDIPLRMGNALEAMLIDAIDQGYTADELKDLLVLEIGSATTKIASLGLALPPKKK